MCLRIVSQTGVNKEDREEGRKQKVPREQIQNLVAMAALQPITLLHNFARRLGKHQVTSLPPSTIPALSRSRTETVIIRIGQKSSEKAAFSIHLKAFLLSPVQFFT